MIHQVHDVAHLEVFLPGVELIHDQVVVIDQRPTLQIMKPAIQPFEVVEIKARNGIEAR